MRPALRGALRAGLRGLLLAPLLLLVALFLTPACHRLAWPWTAAAVALGCVGLCAPLGAAARLDPREKGCLPPSRRPAAILALTGAGALTELALGLLLLLPRSDRAALDRLVEAASPWAHPELGRLAVAGSLYAACAVAVWLVLPPGGPRPAAARVGVTVAGLATGGLWFTPAVFLLSR